MEAAFWFKSWELGGFYTSFHRKDIHPYVLNYLSPEVIENKNILVPLCGKTVDMLYLSQFANKVIGVELVEEAILQFFQENNLPYQQVDAETFVSGNITLLKKDFMALTPAEIGPIDWIYDRASLVALPYEMRTDYLHALDRLSSIGTQTLLITLEYFPLINSAPFSIDANEVEQYYSRGHVIKHVEQPNLPHHGMVRKWNLAFLIEHGFVLTKYADGVMLAEGVQNKVEVQ
ncbi:MAG: thiopurine S-methyltransferase [Spirosomataceae bacterium]